MQARKTKVQYSPCGFCSISLSPEFGIQFVADIPFTSLGRIPPDAAIPDELSRRFQKDSKLELDAWNLFLLVEKHLDEHTNVFLRSGGPLVVAQIKWILLVSQHRQPIAFEKIAQDQ